VVISEGGEVNMQSDNQSGSFRDEPAPLDKLRILENLVEELLKDDPEELRVQSYMQQAGIQDTQDPIDRINKVLRALHFEEPEKEIQE